MDPDPGTRKQIEEYATPEIRDEMRRAYLSKGVGCLYGHDFPQTLFGKDWRNFKEAWYKDYAWLDYSKETNLPIVSIVFFSSLQALVTSLTMMSSLRKGLKIGRMQLKYSMLM